MTETDSIRVIREALARNTEMLEACTEALAQIRATLARYDAQREHCTRTLERHDLALFGPPDAPERGIVHRLSGVERGLAGARAKYSYAVTSLLSAGLTLAGGLALAWLCWMLGWPV